MSDLAIACDTCHPAVQQVFNPGTGTRQVEILVGDLVVTDQCFVRDEIKFHNSGRLIFAPHGDRQEGRYHERYYVICRKLTVIGGFKSGGGLIPCGPDDPGTEYKNNNVITWLHRLSSAPKGPSIISPAANGTSFGGWVNQNQGNNGVDGGTGTSGTKGNPGGDGRSAPRQLIVIALEVDVQPLSHLNIDWDGQNGGDGGRGQNGGNGGKGMNGNIGKSDTTWPGTGCDRDPGNGGNGGTGGNGGPGGDGGRGGNAGDIIIISTKPNITSGPFGDGRISYRNDGGDGGRGGGSGTGGLGGFPGQPGFPTSECGNAFPGQMGQPGAPSPLPPPLDSDPNRGAPGAPGQARAFVPTEIAPGTCADLLPLPMQFDASGFQPSHFCRGFSTPGAEGGSISGQHLKQAVTVGTNLTGVTPSIKFSSTDTQLDLHFVIAGNSATGPGNLTFTRAFGADVVLSGAFSIGKFEVLSIAPSSGAKGNAVNVTITGNCFNPMAALQQVVVSGLGVTVLNVVVVDEHTVQCVLDINALAASGQRDVTVKTGLFTHTLVNGFTIS